MWCRGALLALVLGGCYSPSFKSCELACANGTTCPDGLVCSGGLCGPKGVICADADAAIDTPTTTCGDGIQQAGEVCFKPAYVIATGTSPIYDAQFAEFTGDTHPDLVYLAGSGFVFRTNTNNTFGAPQQGPTTTSQRFRAFNLDTAGSGPELVSTNASPAEVRIWRFGGTNWTPASSSPGLATDCKGVILRPVTHAGEPKDITVAYDNRVATWSLDANLSIAPLGMGVMPPGTIRDVVGGDFDNDNLGEIAVATSMGVVVYDVAADGTYTAKPSPNIPVSSAVGSGDIDNDGDADLYYATTNEVGVRRWTGSGWENTEQTPIPMLQGPIDTADLDGDGRVDLIAATNAGGTLRLIVLLGQADGTLGTPIPFDFPGDVPGLGQLVVNADFSGDGVDDVAVTSPTIGKITIFESDP